MLRPEVVVAVREGKFHVYTVSTIDEGIEVLTGVPAGVRDEEGRYPEGSVNDLVHKRLAEYAQAQRAFTQRNGAEAGEEEEEKEKKEDEGAPAHRQGLGPRRSRH